MNLVSCYAIFSGAYNFNRIVNFPDSVANLGYAFEYCNNFNQSVQLPVTALTYVQGMFSGATKFNQDVQIPFKVTECAVMFRNAQAFNYPVNIPNRVVNSQGMFENAKSFDQPVQIPDSITNCNGMFYNAIIFNQPVHMPNNAVECNYMFSYARAFNQPINVPNRVVNCASIFSGATSMACPVHFGESAYNLWWACAYAPNMTDVYLHRNASMGAYGLLNGSREANVTVHCPNLYYINGTGSGNNAVVSGITYDENWYNAAYKIQLTTSME